MYSLAIAYVQSDHRRPRRLLPVVVWLSAALVATSSAGQTGAGPGAAAYASMMQAWSAGNLDSALKQADRVLAAEPKNVTYLNAVAGLYCDQAQKASVLTKMSWAGKCRSTWERAVEIDPKNIEIRLNLMQFYLQAPGVAGGGVDKARGQANAVAALDAVRGEIAHGNIARSQKQMAEAERRYKRAAELDATGTRGPVALSSFYAAQKRFADAKAIFESRLAKDASDTFAAFQIARLLQSEGTDLERAVRLYTQYVAAPAPAGGPSHADAWFRKGEALEKLGRKAEAVAAFDQALKLAPDHRGATRGLGRLKK